jgi:hypothetical protein
MMYYLNNTRRKNFFKINIFFDVVLPTTLEDVKN